MAAQDEGSLGVSHPAEQWQRVKEIVDEALDIPTRQRPAFVARACGRDESLRREVEALLEREARLGDFLGLPFFSIRAEKDLDVGRELGPYRLLERIGSGGMGTVFLAERADGEVRQHLAIKLLKRGVDTDEIVRRFQMERQILADLSHPYIPQLLDVGSAADGRPFFALEYVEGERIDTWCDAQKLDTHQRVRLMVRVCEAVHFAHQNLVVHRDLKPANILVTADGTPKLLDFGVAKLLASESQFTTRPGAAPLSLPYASPEQLTGASMTTAVDVYALGMVLYELLTGRRAYEIDTSHPELAMRQVLEEKPVRPSFAVTLPAEARPGRKRRMPEEVSQVRDGDPRRLARRLRGDLDNIVLKALAKDPERRYSSAEQLGEDLHRYLAGMPVRARPDTFYYRAGKFLQRHPAGVSATLLAILLVLGFAVGMAHERNRAEHERQRAEHERDVAQQERNRAGWVTEFLMRLPEFADPNREPGQALTLREALDAGTRRLDREFKGEPEVRAALLDGLGTSYRHLAAYEEARLRLEEALASRRRLYGDDHVLVAVTMYNLASLEDDLGNETEAESLMRRALAIQRRGFSEGHRDLARGLNNLAAFLTAQGKVEEAESLARESLTMTEDLFGAQHKDVLYPLSTLANVLRRQGKLSEAETAFRRCVELRRALEGPVSSELSKVLNGLAGTLADQGQLKKARPHFEEALEIRRKLYPGDHPNLVTILNNVGRHYLLLAEPSAAVELLDEAFEMQGRLQPGWSWRSAMLGRSLAWAQLDLGRTNACGELARSALNVIEEHGAGRHIAETKSILGACLAAQGKRDEGLLLLREGYEGLLESLGEEALISRVARERLKNHSA